MGSEQPQGGLFQPFPQSDMDSGKEKDFETASTPQTPPEARRVEFYDPSKESAWTRAGLTFESFKRAPGTTGCVSSARSEPLPNHFSAVKSYLARRMSKT